MPADEWRRDDEFEEWWAAGSRTARSAVAPSRRHYRPHLPASPSRERIHQPPPPPQEAVAPPVVERPVEEEPSRKVDRSEPTRAALDALNGARVKVLKVAAI